MGPMSVLLSLDPLQKEALGSPKKCHHHAGYDVERCEPFLIGYFAYADIRVGLSTFYADPGLKHTSWIRQSHAGLFWIFWIL